MYIRFVLWLPVQLVTVFIYLLVFLGSQLENCSFCISHSWGGGGDGGAGDGNRLLLKKVLVFLISNIILY